MVKIKLKSKIDSFDIMPYANDNEQQDGQAKERIAVVVLGDIGHSPRMNYHALSLSKEGFEVSLIGLAGAKPSSDILEDGNITLTYMRPCPVWFNILPKVLCLIFKVFWQAFILFFTLFLGPTPSKLLLQNPPAVPTMPVCWFYCLITCTKFFIDWHNYGYSIMALSLGQSHFLVKVYRFIERWFGGWSSGGLCVTKAMKEDLEKNWGVKNITVHYDRPPSQFRPLFDEERHEFYLKMGQEFPCFSSSSPDKSVFSQRFADGRITFYEDRPALVVSSTSWTEDEDFSLLVHALNEFDKIRTKAPNQYPKLVVVITGKGPLKEKYLEDMNKLNWQHIAVVTPWLSHKDYPKLLASADMGISLHYSSSGLDLPMKVVDMFGCRLPVMALSYPTLSELVKHRINGLTFSSKEELSDLLVEWFKGFPKQTVIRESQYDFYKNIETFRQVKWHSSWEKNVLPVLSQNALEKKKSS